jgi:N-acetylmuramoyl-L-alanine amidase
MDRVERITVHHTAELPAMTQRTDAELVRSVQAFHQDERGWADIGYHFVVGRAGDVFEGRPLDVQGAHAGGGNNVRNLGVSVIGDWGERLPPPPALATLERLLDDLMRRHGVPAAKVHGHRDFKPTECPGESLYAWLQAFKGARAQRR